MDKLDTFQDQVNGAVRINEMSPIKVNIGDVTFDRVTRARKYNGRQFGSSKLYTDIILDNNSKSIKISLKEDVISSVHMPKKAIDMMVPNLVDKFINAVASKVLSMGLNENDDLPRILYGKINRINKSRLIIGTQAMGGPIDYIYIGSAKAQFNTKEDILQFDGFLIDSKDYAENQEIYLRIMLKSSAKFRPDMKKQDVIRSYDVEGITIVPDNKDGITVTV